MPRAADRSGGRGGVRTPGSAARRTAAALAAAFALAPVLATPATAHPNGSAIVRVERLALEPEASSWRASLLITDCDSGSPITGSKVTAQFGSGAATTLAAAPTPGGYDGVLADAKPGTTTLAVRVRANPGAEPVEPFARAWTVELVAGRATTVVGGTGVGGVVPLWPFVGGGAIALLTAVAFGVGIARRGPDAPDAVS